MNRKTRELLIKTRRRLFGQNIGNNISAFRGNGLDFAELKEYSYGDDVRKINWNVTAREQKPYINVFNEERELNIVIAFILGGTIHFGSVRQKKEVMAEILGLLSFSAINNSDRVTTLFFDSGVERYFKPTKNPKSIFATMEHALDVDVLGRKTDLQALADYLLKSVRARSVVLLIGDFYEKADLSFLAAKHELYAIIVRDPFEERPSFDGEYDLVDPVSGEHSVIDIDRDLLSEYRKVLESHDEALYEEFAANRIAHTKIYTDEDPFIKLVELLK
ncbi:hypothetical protein NNO_1265 [Hydrogenimonas sp.]|nr:hypothetical protein NNO_1265 [Hydrogenimonas sp.]